MPSAEERYEELHQALASYHARQDEYHNACRQFILDVRNELAAYLGRQPSELPLLHYRHEDFWDNLTAWNPEEHVKDFVKFDPSRRFWLDEQAWWHAQVELDFGRSFLIWPVAVRRTDEGFWLHGEEEDRLFKQGEASKAAEYIYGETREYLAGAFERFVQGNRPRNIGYRTSDEQ